MPKDPLAANATPMPIDRRAALGALVAAGALFAARPAKADNLDADLFALSPEIEAADRAHVTAIEALEAAERRTLGRVPEKPAAPEMDPERLSAVQEFARRMAELTLREPSPEKLAYDEAQQRWEADKARILAEGGVDAAIEAESAALQVVMEVERRLAKTPARTLAGLIFKARYAASRDYEPDVMTAIIDDLCAMAGEA